MLIPKEGLGVTKNHTLIEVVPTKMEFEDRAALVLAIIGKNSNVATFITETATKLEVMQSTDRPSLHGIRVCRLLMGPEHQ